MFYVFFMLIHFILIFSFSNKPTVHGRIEMMHARMLPMVVPPKKWVAYDEGNF